MNFLKNLTGLRAAAVVYAIMIAVIILMVELAHGAERIGDVEVAGEVYPLFIEHGVTMICWLEEEEGFVGCLTESEQELLCTWIPPEKGWFHNCQPRNGF